MVLVRNTNNIAKTNKLEKFAGTWAFKKDKKGIWTLSDALKKT